MKRPSSSRASTRTSTWNLDVVDFKNLNDRLHANSIQEMLTNLWLDRAFGREDFKQLYGGAKSAA